MKKCLNVALALLLVGCVTLSACNGKKENSTTETSSDETASSADPAASSLSNIDPEIVEKLTATEKGADAFWEGKRVYLSSEVPVDTGGGAADLHVTLADKDANTTELGVIPRVFSGPDGIVSMDPDYYMFVTQYHLNEDLPDADEMEKVLVRISPEKSEVEEIHYSEGIVDWQNLSPYASSVYSVGRKVVFLDGYIAEEVTGLTLRTFITVYDVDTKTCTREKECTINKVQTKGDILFRMCSDGEKIYTLYDVVDGKNSTTYLVALDSDFTELQRIEIGEDMNDVCNRSRVWKINVWKDLIFFSYNADDGQKIFIGRLGEDKIEKVTELQNYSVVGDTEGSAPVLVEMETNTICMISESGETRAVRLQMDGVEESFISQWSLEGSTLYVNMYYEKDHGYGFADYLIHLDKIGADTREIVLPN
ncbi:MAG: hypothetical protein J5750_07880 [Clostridiales bacterium]|nr:hypothetical protein [Clostridiales bacterium]